jgi:hypothetical protein
MRLRSPSPPAMPVYPVMRTQHSTSDTVVSGNPEACFHMGRVQQKLLQELLNPPLPSQLRLVTFRDLN